MQVNKANPSFTGIVQVGKRIGEESLRQSALIDDVCVKLDHYQNNLVKKLYDKLGADIAVIPISKDAVNLKILHSTIYGDFFAKGKDGREIVVRLRPSKDGKKAVWLNGFTQRLNAYIKNPNFAFMQKKEEAFQKQFSTALNRVDRAFDQKQFETEDYFTQLYAVGKKRDFVKETLVE